MQPTHLKHTPPCLSHLPARPAGIPWLIDRFKQYVVLRDRLFSDTSVLRGKLQEAIPGEPLEGWILPVDRALLLVAHPCWFQPGQADELIMSRPPCCVAMLLNLLPC